MVYQDALVALFAFGGIYGAGVFGWQATELGIFGILLTITGTIGALIGGQARRSLRRQAGDPRRDRRCWRSSASGILSLGRDHILFVVPTAPPVEGLYGSVPEKLFLVLGLVIGAVAGPLQASSRSLLARLVPAAEAGALFRPAGALRERSRRSSRPLTGRRRDRRALSSDAGGGAGGADPVLLRRRLVTAA